MLLLTFAFLALQLSAPLNQKTPGTQGSGTAPSKTASTTKTSPTGDGTALKSAPTKDSTAVAVTATKDGTAVATAATKDGTAVATAATKDGTALKLPKRKIVYKTVDPGFRAPPLFRTSPMGPSAVWGGFGFKAGITDHSTGGFLVNLGYSYRLSKQLWADTSFSMNFGGDCSRPSPDSDAMQCGGMNGFGLDLLGGIMYRFLNKPRWKIPLNPYAKALGGVSFIIANGPNDGAALVVKGVGGARYSFTEAFAAGAEIGVTFGSSFRNVSGAGFFMAIDFLLSAEYAF